MRRLLVLSLLLCLSGSARAKPAPSPVTVDPWIDGSALFFGLGLWLAPSLVVDQVEPRCDPCDPRELNALDRPVVHFDSKAADVASDIFVVTVPALALSGTLASKGRWGWRGVAEDATLVAESMVAAGMLHQAVRFAVRRPRPFMYRSGARPDIRGDGASSLSFFSGHTAVTFAAATSLAYTFSLRHPESDLRPLVWVAALLTASTVPLSRVASGEHFWTDVLVGAAVGSGLGVLIPALHRRRNREVRLTLSAGWVGLHGRF